MVQGRGDGGSRWTVDLSPEASTVLRDLRTRDKAQYLAITSNLESLARLCCEIAPHDLEPVLHARFAYKPLKGDARKEGLLQIAIGRGDRYRAALLRLDPLRQILVVHLYSKNQQDKGIARAIAIARERQDVDQ